METNNFLNNSQGGRCSMGDACSNPPTAEGVYQFLAKVTKKP